MKIDLTDSEAYELGRSGIEAYSSISANTACQSLGWLIITGFGLTVPVLILKTWRLHQIIVRARLGGTRKRQYVRKTDMFKAMFAYFIVAYTIMMTWTIGSPMIYELSVTEYDEYQNPISAYGYCKLGKGVAEGLFIILVLLMLFCIILGNVVCFLARNDESTNNEVMYIALSLINFFEMIFIGGPVAILFQSQPLYRFLVVAFCTFVSFEGCVCLIFIPKIIAVLYYDPTIEGYNDKSNGIQLGTPSVHVNAGMKNLVGIIERAEYDEKRREEDSNKLKINEASNPMRS